jgi:hypothetical protein
VTSQGDIDAIIEMVQIKDIILVTFGDMIRVPVLTAVYKKSAARALISESLIHLWMLCASPGRIRIKK